MALANALLRYKQEGRLLSFNMLSEKKAEARLASGRKIGVYMSDQYIIGLAEVQEAVAAPRVDYMVYNSWDRIGTAAFQEGRRLGIEIHTFGAFGHRLDELNVEPG